MISAIIGSGFGLIAFFMGYYGAYTGAELIASKLTGDDGGSGSDDDGLLHVDDDTANKIDERF